MQEKSQPTYPISDKKIKQMQDKQAQTSPSALPFTIKAHALLGYHFKYWLIALTIIIALELALFLSMQDQLGQYMWAIGVQVAAIAFVLVVLFFVQFKKSLTISQQGIEIRNGDKATTIPYENLDPVIRGWAYYGGNVGVAIAISSKKMDIRYVASALNWSKEDLRKFYASVPAQYRDDSSDPRKYVSI